MEFKTIEWLGNSVKIIDQTALPFKEEYLVLHNYKDVAEAIKEMKIRGAPAIGVIAGYGVALAAIEYNNKEEIEKAIKILGETRPTAYNLFYALKRMKRILEERGSIEDFISEAIAIHKEDKEITEKIGENGVSLLKDNGRYMTICNAGALATGGIGTALAVFYKGKEKGKNITVYVPETRPYLQGARLTTWELMKNGIKAILIADGAKAFTLKTKRVDLIITGADRIALNGDAANKIGTYGLAIASKHLNIPFYIAAPSTTFDPNIKTGDEIPIEKRSPDEVRNCRGEKIAQGDVEVYNPAFDITPSVLISGIITEKGVLYPPYQKTIQEIR